MQEISFERDFFIEGLFSRGIIYERDFFQEDLFQEDIFQEDLFQEDLLQEDPPRGISFQEAPYLTRSPFEKIPLQGDPL